MIFLIIISSSLYPIDTLRFAIGDWEPFTSSRDNNGKIAEIIIREVFALEGIDAQFEYFPWKRSYELSRSGEYDGTFPWIKSKSREQDFYFTNEILFKDSNVFFSMKSTSFDWSNWEDLKKYTIGSILGYYPALYLKERGIISFDVQKEDLMYNMLLAGRIDTFVGSEIVGKYQIEMLFHSDTAILFETHPKPLFIEDYYLMISKNNPDALDILEIFDSGIQKLRSSGRFDEIMSRLAIH